MADDAAEEQPGRGRGRPFQPGQSGNPSGRPPGSRSAVALAVEELLEGQAETLTERAIKMALEGDARAMRLCLDRVVPLRRGKPVRFALQPIKVPADVVAALGDILTAVAAGDLTPDEGHTIAGIVETKRRSIEILELEARLAALEQAATERGR